MIAQLCIKQAISVCSNVGEICENLLLLESIVVVWLKLYTNAKEILCHLSLFDKKIILKSCRLVNVMILSSFSF